MAGSFCKKTSVQSETDRGLVLWFYDTRLNDALFGCYGGDCVLLNRSSFPGIGDTLTLTPLIKKSMIIAENNENQQLLIGLSQCIRGSSIWNHF